MNNLTINTNLSFAKKYKFNGVGAFNIVSLSVYKQNEKETVNVVLIQESTIITTSDINLIEEINE
jgi:hypothetical protein